MARSIISDQAASVTVATAGYVRARGPLFGGEVKEIGLFSKTQDSVLKTVS